MAGYLYSPMNYPTAVEGNTNCGYYSICHASHSEHNSCHSDINKVENSSQPLKKC